MRNDIFTSTYSPVPDPLATLQQVGFLVLETFPRAEHLRKRGLAIERVEATEDLPVVDLLVFLMVDSMPSARQVCQC